MQLSGQLYNKLAVNSVFLGKLYYITAYNY